MVDLVGQCINSFFIIIINYFIYLVTEKKGNIQHIYTKNTKKLKSVKSVTKFTKRNYNW